MSLTDKQKFSMQKTAAINRGINWQLTFDDWQSWWINSGNYINRGCKKGQYLMARFNDVGPYSLSNIFCCTFEQNNSDRHKFNSYMSKTGKANAKQIKTPLGIFKSKSEAAKFYNLDSSTISYRLAKYPNDFYYLGNS